ncbi:MAG: LapA family protein [Thermodesulfobacteriota bacterium]
MRYVKAFIIGLLALLALVFVIENIEVLKHQVQLRLDLYLVNLQAAPLDLWILIILSFGLGALLVLIYFIYDHIKQRQTIRQLKQNVEIMSAELKRAGKSGESMSAPVYVSSPSKESQEYSED